MTPRTAYGITGFIGAGKTFVAQQLADRGCAIYSADQAAQRLVLLPSMRSHLVGLLGEEAYLPNGEYNRRYVASRIFQFPTLRASIESLVHPAVFEDFRLWSQEVDTRYPFVFMESALLPRLAWRSFLHALILVTTPAEARLLRIVARDHTTRELALQRIASQPDEMQYYAAAHFIIENTTAERLAPQLDRLLEILQRQNAIQ